MSTWRGALLCTSQCSTVICTGFWRRVPFCNCSESEYNIYIMCQTARSGPQIWQVLDAVRQDPVICAISLYTVNYWSIDVAGPPCWSQATCVCVCVCSLFVRLMCHLRHWSLCTRKVLFTGWLYRVANRLKSSVLSLSVVFLLRLRRQERRRRTIVLG